MMRDPNPADWECIGLTLRAAIVFGGVVGAVLAVSGLLTTIWPDLPAAVLRVVEGLA